LDRREGPPALWGDAIKKTLRHIIVFAIIVVALYLLLPRLVDTQQTVQYISKASYVLLVLAVALEVAALLGSRSPSAASP
jgi:type II secretory pathway pseudopilin PulG